MKEYKEFLVEIYKVESEKYNSTRELHWKINIAVWTVLAASIIIKAQKGFLSIDSCSQILLLFGYAGMHFLFILYIHASLWRSLTRMHNMATFLLSNQANGLSWTDFSKPVPQPYKYWELWQILITIFLCIVFSVIKQNP